MFFFQISSFRKLSFAKNKTLFYEEPEQSEYLDIADAVISVFNLIVGGFVLLLNIFFQEKGKLAQALLCEVPQQSEYLDIVDAVVSVFSLIFDVFLFPLNIHSQKTKFG